MPVMIPNYYIPSHRDEVEEDEVIGNERILPGKGYRKARPKAEDSGLSNIHYKEIRENGTADGNKEEAVRNIRREVSLKIRLKSCFLFLYKFSGW